MPDHLFIYSFIFLFIYLFIYLSIYLLRLALQGSTGSRETFLTIVLRDQFLAQHVMPHSWKGGWFWFSQSAMFPVLILRHLLLVLLPLVNSPLCWHLAVPPKPLTMGSCWQMFLPRFPQKINYLPDQLAEITSPAAMGCLELMKSWEKWREKETRTTVWVGLPLSEVNCLYTKGKCQTVPSGTRLPLLAV